MRSPSASAAAPADAEAAAVVSAAARVTAPVPAVRAAEAAARATVEIRVLDHRDPRLDPEDRRRLVGRRRHYVVLRRRRRRLVRGEGPDEAVEVDDAERDAGLLVLEEDLVKIVLLARVLAHVLDDVEDATNAGGAQVGRIGEVGGGQVVAVVG